MNNREILFLNIVYEYFFFFLAERITSRGEFKHRNGIQTNPVAVLVNVHKVLRAPYKSRVEYIPCKSGYLSSFLSTVLPTRKTHLRERMLH